MCLIVNWVGEREGEGGFREGSKHIGRQDVESVRYPNGGGLAFNEPLSGGKLHFCA